MSKKPTAATITTPTSARRTFGRPSRRDGTSGAPGAGAAVCSGVALTVGAPIRSTTGSGVG